MENEIIHCNDASFQKVITGSGKPVLVDFWAPWCGPCRALGPLLEKLAAEYGSDVTVVKVNVDESQQLAMQYNISAIPTMIFFKGGQVADMLRGLVGYDMLVEKVKALQ